MRRAARVLTLALTVACGSGCQGRERAPTDLSGEPVDVLAGPAVKALVFVRSDCPVSNRYAPRLARLFASHQGRAELYAVFVDPDETAEVVSRHVEEYALPLTPVLDPHHVLVAATGVTTTPEASVHARGKQQYRGRIDDWYAGYGKPRAEPRTHDLEVALDAAIAGRPAPEAEGPPVGCPIPPPR